MTTATLNSPSSILDKTYIRTAMNTPMLSREEEQCLANKWSKKKDEKALHKLTQSYMRLVVSMAHKFKFYGLPVNDLIQEGNVGLLQAAMKFDTAKDVRFSTYATWWVRAAIQDFVLRNWSIVRTGTTSAHKSLFFKLRYLRQKIDGASTDQGLTEQGRIDVAEHLDVRVKDVEEMERRLFQSDQSLNAPVSREDGNDTDWLSLMPSNTPTPEEIVTQSKDEETHQQWIEDALSHLKDREQLIIRKRHLQEDSVTLEVLGKELGVSKERVRQIEADAMKKLKKALSENI